MRCVGSSPAAAARALRTRAALDVDDEEAALIEARIRDDEETVEDDLEPGAALDDPRLAALIAQADTLAADLGRDPKLALLRTAVETLVADGFKPVVFCRYVATAETVGKALAAAFRGHSVDVVTGELPPDDREARVLALSARERPILVATDCLSEGVNLQSYFDAVIHYDLSWNPTRHQQREGRVDRYGQPSKVVRTLLLYGENNPVDGAVLEVILRKAQTIERQTGVRVPLPDDGGSLTEALMSAVLLRARQDQLSLDFSVADSDAARGIEVAWTNASENERKARTIFAQHSLRPEDVVAEWDRSRAALGSFADVERFVSRALTRLGAALAPAGESGFSAPLHLTPLALRERFQTDGLLDADVARPLKVAFSARPRAGFQSVHRAHPLPAILAERFLETALDDQAPENDPATLPRCGVWEAEGVTSVTTVLLLRVRHRINSRGRLGPRFAMAEEAAAVAVDAATGSRIADGDDAFALLERDSASVPERVRDAQLARASDVLAGWRALLDAYGAERAAALAADHTRVRQALGSRAEVKVDAVTPVDVIGLYVLMPKL